MVSFNWFQQYNEERSPGVCNLFTSKGKNNPQEILPRSKTAQQLAHKCWRTQLRVSVGSELGLPCHLEVVERLVEGHMVLLIV